MNPLMPAVGTLVVCFGIAVIVFRKRVVKGIERKAKKIGSPMISKSAKSDGPGRVIEVGVGFIAIGIVVILNGGRSLARLSPDSVMGRSAGVPLVSTRTSLSYS